MANSHPDGWFGLRFAGHSWNNDPVTSVGRFCGPVSGGVEIVVKDSGAKVIFLQSHPTWVAAQRREQELRQAMRRHPSVRARQHAAASGGAVVRNFKVYSSADTSA